MKTKLSLLSIMFNAMLALFFGSVVSFANPEIGAGTVAGLVFALGTIPQLLFSGTGANFAFMALQTEVWTADIAEQLFAGNEFLNFATDHSQYVINKTVHVPQSGTAPSIEKNRSSLPASIGQRTDSELTYNLDEFTTDPIIIPDLEEIQNSYDKRQSVTGQHFATLADRVAREILYNWTPSSSRVILTTGATTALLPNATATGTRKKLTKDDLAKLATKMDQDNVPAEGRFILLDSIMFGDLFSVSEIMSFDFMRGASDQSNGVITKLFGFNVLKRSSVVKFNGSSTKVAIGTADATTDCAGSLAWSRYSVARAIGDTKIFVDEDKPEYYGSLFSAMVLAGGKALRSDNAGIYAISQGS